MTAILSPQQEIAARLREVHAERRRIIKKLGKLDDRETDLLTQLQDRGSGNGEQYSLPDFSMFKDTTRRLLTEFWVAPDRMLSHEDIRQDVIGDDLANDCTVWQVICRANAELVKKKFPFEIKNVKKKGYRLVPQI